MDNGESGATAPPGNSVEVAKKKNLKKKNPGKKAGTKEAGLL